VSSRFIVLFSNVRNVTRFLRATPFPILPGTYVEISAFIFITGDTVMASNAGIFFAGVGTTFIILGIGFGGGLMLATSALKEPSGFQNRTSAEPPSPARVILPSTAEAAQPPQPFQATQPSQQQIAPAPEPSRPFPAQPVKEAEAPVEKQIEKVDTKPTKAESRRKRYAEYKAKRQAERAKRQQQIEQSEHLGAPIMAFGGDEPRPSGGFGFFGN
jgi:type IV secretory pathway VirJ component